jgi:hypothetical protein
MLTPERQFEIEASTMSRDQLYDLAKRQAVEIARLEVRFGTTMIEMTKLSRKFPCGHRIIDWDDSYGECVVCKVKEFSFENERENELLRHELAEARGMRMKAEYFQVHLTVNLHNNPYCRACGAIDPLEPRHAWTDEQWIIQAAKKD